MHFSTFVGTVALCAGAQAFSDTTPFILSSTAVLDVSTPIDQLQSNTHVLKTAKNLLASCPTDKYVVVSQPSLHSKDLESSASSPTLYSIVQGDAIRSTFSVAGMYGEIASEDLLAFIRKACAARYEKGDISISSLPLPTLPVENRAVVLRENDDMIADVLANAPLGDSYTILYLSDVRDVKYEAQFKTVFSSGMKRDDVVTRKSNATVDNRKFFEKYQLFNAGIYMTLLATFFMMTILYVGLQALASLEVSVGAFDKDMGPSAQKK
ncbi:hypothetical protein TD95_003922 [Thielaviopsis punctulata]|uniref:Protein BIG1 n=1 Tax=Thielaviopsis punctulata TaxID=72032 RepID=A0A0F4ZBC0_9PEZI|nr:hypothetical protein TD95_003922 [Thielaviopsis punctulata]